MLTTPRPGWLRTPVLAALAAIVILTTASLAVTARADAAERAAVLAANEAFYDAFRNKDMAAMAEVWAERDGVVMVPPGGILIQGRDNVLATLERILTNPATGSLTAENPEVHLQGSSAVVVVYERIGRSLLVATNVFIDTDRGWRMVHHHVGPTPFRPQAETEGVPT